MAKAKEIIIQESEEELQKYLRKAVKYSMEKFHEKRHAFGTVDVYLFPT